VFIANSAKAEQIQCLIPPVSTELMESTAVIHQEMQTIQKSQQERLNVFAEKYGVNVMLAKNIIFCESKFHQNAINENKTKEGEVWSRDWGYWQINDYYWKEDLKEKGWDITVPEQNLEAGFYLLKTYGTKLWKASQHCWG
jgi:hypothetical protein